MSTEEFETGVNLFKGKTNKEVYEDTLEMHKLIRDHPNISELVVCWEHEFDQDLLRFPFLQNFAWRLRYGPPVVETQMTETRMEELIREGKLFGFVECDLEVEDPAIWSLSHHFL